MERLINFWAYLALLEVVVCQAWQEHYLEVDMYRAMEGHKASQFLIENNNLASLIGNLKYIHTEVIPEEAIAPPARMTRKYDIDAIVRWTYRVQNPVGMLNQNSGLLTQVDFGPYTTFDSGVATNEAQQDSIRDWGGYVGVQEQRGDNRFVSELPYYWFSLIGFCPNIDWGSKGTIDNPNPDCLRYRDGRLVTGGICNRGNASAAGHPTGAPDCTYSYSEPHIVWLDQLAGILEQDCGRGRRCRDWADYRRHCADESLRRKFAPDGTIVTASFCVEYDIHPACSTSCTAPACLAVPEDERELGLLFWRGRCDSQRNRERGEALAATLGSRNASRQHLLLQPNEAESWLNAKCLYPEGMCVPNPEVGGTYCTRSWSGVCQPCWIPGTKLAYPDGARQAVCPYSVLMNVDYKDNAKLEPKCSSDRPRDLCCLYFDPPRCSISMTGSVADLPLDEDGYALVAARQDTDLLVQFLRRLIERDPSVRVYNEIGLREFAYWHWSTAPIHGVSLSDMEAGLKHFVRSVVPRSFHPGARSLPQPEAAVGNTEAPTAAAAATTTTRTVAETSDPGVEEPIISSSCRTVSVASSIALLLGSALHWPLHG